MITSKEVERLYLVNPFNEKDSTEIAFESGIDLDEIAKWAETNVGRPAAILGSAIDYEKSLVAVWLSGLRIGFFLGRGYIEDGQEQAL
jgi:hypothetical protein